MPRVRTKPQDANAKEEGGKKGEQILAWMGIPVPIWVVAIPPVLTAVGMQVARPTPPPATVATAEATKVQRTLNEVSGGFRTPKGGVALTGETRKPVRIPCGGWFTDLPAEYHLWVAVERSGLIWFKTGEIESLERRGIDGTSGDWSIDITEEAETEKEFSVSLWAANDEGNEFIEKWLAKGSLKNDYEELTDIPGAIRVARIDGLSIKSGQ